MKLCATTIFAVGASALASHEVNAQNELAQGAR